MNREHNIRSVSSGLLESSAMASFSGIKAEVLLGGPSAPFSVMAMEVTEGLGSPAHVSFTEDKVFIVTGGEFLFLVGDHPFNALRGAHVFVARGEVHSFCALTRPASNLTLVSSPSLHDAFFQHLSGLATPHAETEVRAVCEQFHQAIVGPIVSA